MIEKYHARLHNSARGNYIQDQELDRARKKVSDIESVLFPPNLYPMLQISVFCKHFEITSTILEKLLYLTIAKQT